MSFWDTFVDYVSNPERLIDDLMAIVGDWIYILLFLFIFAETGLVVMALFSAFLPGDALLFAVGIIAAKHKLDIGLIVPLLILATLLGDNLNYFIGTRIGNRLNSGKKVLFIKKEHINQTSDFFKKYGKNAIIIARFIPVVRSMVPFVSGATHLSYGVFFLYSLVGALLWAAGVTLLGYFLGNFEWVKKNMGLVIWMIIIASNFNMLKHLIEKIYKTIARKVRLNR